MNVILTGVTVSQDTQKLGFEKNNDVDIFTATVDTDTNWEYKLDVQYTTKAPNGEYLYNIINLTRSNNVCTVLLTSDMLPFNGRYILQLRGINGDKVYHSDTFEAWVKYSIEPEKTYNPVPSEFYQIEKNINDLNSHPPVPGENGKWMIWNSEKQEYEESDFPLPGEISGKILPEFTENDVNKILMVTSPEEISWVDSVVITGGTAVSS